MKKFFAALALMMLPVIAQASTTKISQVDYAAHGDKCFAVLTVAMEDDIITAACIDEFQFLPEGEVTAVPNSESAFGESYPEGMVLASKRLNSEYYSAKMEKAGSTTALKNNYSAIEDFVVGKTIEELKAAVEGKDSAAMVDAVSGCTLVDTLSYINGLIAAAEAAN